MFRYTNIMTGSTITTNAEIRGKNWMKSDEIEDFRKQAKEAKNESETKEEKVEEKAEEPVVSKMEIPQKLDELTNADLKELLYRMGVDYNNKVNKAELIKLVEANR